MQGFAHALLARLERARLARSQAASRSNAGLWSGLGSAGPPAAALLGVSAADVQELLDDALAEGCRVSCAGPADDCRLQGGNAEGIRGLQLSVSGAPANLCWYSLYHNGHIKPFRPCVLASRLPTWACCLVSTSPGEPAGLGAQLGNQ